MKISVYNKQGEETEKIDIADSFLDMKRNDDLVHQVFVSLLSNRRQTIAHTKTRGERAGSGAKPWKQKGTGRARVGSVRTPVWKKGGVAFGPSSERNYKKKINKKMNTKAVAIVLAEKVRDKRVFLLDSFDFTENKTRYIAEIIGNLKIKGRTLMLFLEKDVAKRKASQNLEKVKNSLVEKLNVMDMLNTQNIFMSKEAFNFLIKKYWE